MQHSDKVEVAAIADLIVGPGMANPPDDRTDGTCGELITLAKIAEHVGDKKRTIGRKLRGKIDPAVEWSRGKPLTYKRAEAHPVVKRIWGVDIDNPPGKQ